MKLFMFILLLASDGVLGLSFDEAIARIENHEKVKSIASQGQSFEAHGQSQASWGDPLFKIAAKNFPDSLEDDQTPMTGIEFFVSQKIPLSAQRSHLGVAFLRAGKSKYWDALYTKSWLHRLLWGHAINLKKLKSQKSIVEENIRWIAKIISVSKNLYANGKVSQQAILDLQIRKSELRIMLVEISFSIETEMNNLKYLVGEVDSPLDLGSFPWKLLKFQNKKSSAVDNKELSLISMLESKSSMLLSKQSASTPDITVGVGYTKRSDIDGKGDFISLMAQIPIPVSDRRGAEYEKAIYDKVVSEQRLLEYKKKKKTELDSLEIKNRKLISEIDILQNESISFARNARKIAAKSYQLGAASYISLLNSELKLQSLLLKNTDLIAERSLNTLEYKFISGEKLYE